jgi:predicted DCC family thiol-disulfide oxidoreductase YuxK
LGHIRHSSTRPTNTSSTYQCNLQVEPVIRQIKSFKPTYIPQIIAKQHIEKNPSPGLLFHLSIDMVSKTLKITAALVALVSFLVVQVPPSLIPPSTESRSILMYDGVCNLCNGFVNFVADHDANKNVLFGAQQKYMTMLEKRGAPTDLSTLVLIQGDEFYLYSSAALRTFALMDQPYRSLSAAYAIPEFIRDWVYKIVARNRYWMFGQSEKCRAPSEEFRSRFLGYSKMMDKDTQTFVNKMVQGNGKVRALGPAYTRGEIEPPAGKRTEGTSTRGVYTPEQQARLNIDEDGKQVSQE